MWFERSIWVFQQWPACFHDDPCSSHASCAAHVWGSWMMPKGSRTQRYIEVPLIKRGHGFCLTISFYSPIVDKKADNSFWASLFEWDSPLLARLLSLWQHAHSCGHRRWTNPMKSPICPHISGAIWFFIFPQFFKFSPQFFLFFLKSMKRSTSLHRSQKETQRKLHAHTNTSYLTLLSKGSEVGEHKVD